MSTNELMDVDAILGEYELSHLEGLGGFAKSVKLARGMALLQKAIQPHMGELMAMRGSKLGFRTDRDSTDKPYPESVIRDALVEGMLRGARPVGNEINVIGGNCYLTREFFERRLRELDGLTDLEIEEGVPANAGERGALVEMHATWRLHGRPMRLDCAKSEDRDTRIPVRMNAGMGADAVLGKARRKLLARIYARCTGSEWAQAEAEEDIVDGQVVETVAVEPQAERLEAPEGDEALRSFADYCGRKAAACRTQLELDAVLGEILANNRHDEERKKIVLDAVGLREMELQELAEQAAG